MHPDVRIKPRPLDHELNISRALVPWAIRNAFNPAAISTEAIPLRQVLWLTLDATAQSQNSALLITLVR